MPDSLVSEIFYTLKSKYAIALPYSYDFNDKTGYSLKYTLILLYAIYLNIHLNTVG